MKPLYYSFTITLSCVYCDFYKPRKKCKLCKGKYLYLAVAKTNVCHFCKNILINDLNPSFKWQNLYCSFCITNRNTFIAKDILTKNNELLEIVKKIENNTTLLLDKDGG
jgi:hypothetical protein